MATIHGIVRWVMSFVPISSQFHQSPTDLAGAVDLKPRDPTHLLSLGIALAVSRKARFGYLVLRLGVTSGSETPPSPQQLRCCTAPAAASARGGRLFSACICIERVPGCSLQPCQRPVDLDEIDQGEHHFQRALGLNWGYAKAHNNLGKLLGSRDLTIDAK